MNCELVVSHLSCWLDGQLPPDEAAALESHLSTCRECRALAEALRAQDSDLKRAFAPHRQAAQRVASNVLIALEHDRPQATNRPRSFGWSSLLLAAAAGFLLAVLLFQPWKSPTIASPHVAKRPGQQASAEPPPAERHAAKTSATEPPVAELVVATGKVQLRKPQTADWLPVADLPGFACPTGTTVKTGPDVRCELKTAAGCVVRLNGDTEVTLTSSSGIEVQQGQVWCSSPPDASLFVCAAPAPPASEPPLPPKWFAACPSNASLLTAVGSDGHVQVTTGQGEIDVQTAGDAQRLKTGESASIVQGRFVKAQRTADPLLEASWIHALLVRKGEDDKELAGRVDQLLARLGQSKVSFLYEQEIRNLGEHAALPLLRFVQSPLSEDQPQLRLKALRILSDIVPSWLIPDLVQLLSNQDAETRVLSARALQRLTGLDHGRPPDDWRVELRECAASIQQWQQWLAENRQLYLRPASRVL
jgi:hypothetical protein